MSINILPGKGTILQMKSGSFVTIGQRIELDGPDAQLRMRETTHLDSTMAAYRADIPEGGILSGRLFWDPNDSTATVSHQTLRGRVYTPPTTPDEFKLIYNDGFTTPANDDFKGFIKKWKPTGMKSGESLQVEFEIQITDQYTITAGTP